MVMALVEGIVHCVRYGMYLQANLAIQLLCLQNFAAGLALLGSYGVIAVSTSNIAHVWCHITLLWLLLCRFAVAL